MDSHRASVSTLFGENVSIASSASEGLFDNVLLGDEDREKRHFFLSVRCNGLMKNKHFAECIPMLERLVTVEKNQWFKLKTQLKLQECIIRCDMKQRAELEMEKTRKLALAIPDMNFGDAVSLATEYEQQRSYLHAISIYISAIDITVASLSRDSSCDNVTEGFLRVRNIAQCLKNSLDEAKSLTCAISADCLIELLEKLIAKSRFREAHVEAVCLNNIGITLSIAGKLRDAETYFRRGMKLMEDEYPHNSSKYSVYGNLLNNLGRVSLSFGYKIEAKTYFMKSVMAWNLAENFASDSQKSAQISVALNKVRMIEQQSDGQ